MTRSFARHISLLLLATAPALLAACGGSARGLETEKPMEAREISPDDSRISCIGRFVEEEDGLLMGYPGSAIRIVFRGTRVSATLGEVVEDGGPSYFEVVLDGRTHKTIQVTSESEHLLFESQAPEEHELELFKRTEAYMGVVMFSGFTVIGELLDRPALKPKRVLVVGDSISTGMGNMGRFTAETTGQSGITNENENNYLAYGAVFARLIDAEYLCVCYSGKGLARDFLGSTRNQLPDLFPRALPDDESPAADLDEYIPDVVVLNLGVNDFGEANGSVPDEETFVGTYIDFIDTLLEHYPDAFYILGNDPIMSDDYPVGWNAFTVYQEYLDAVVAHFRPRLGNRISKFVLQDQPETYGEDWHPGTETHRKMAEGLAAHLTELQSLK